ncbi:MAG: alpha/beta fold hydrolase [Methylacidiphilales bacterium]|nr:alpha/beta fold hydrolase [Candidatus Methylacidiphilales bacterium]
MIEEKIRLTSLGDSVNSSLYLPEGSGPFPVLLISHGAGEHHRNYREMCDYMVNRGIACHVPDMHGHGESEGERFHVRMEQWVPDLQAAIDYLVTDKRIDPDKICALGLSSGGTAILETALVDHRLRALIALDATVRTSLPFILDMILRVCVLIGTIKKRMTGDDMRYPLSKITGPIAIASDPAVDQRLHEDPTTLKASMAFPFPGSKEAFYVDTIKRVPGITAPTLVIWGEEDQLDTPKTAHLLHAALRCKKDLQIVPGNGHVGHLDRNRAKVFELTAEWILSNTNTPLGSPRLIEGKAAKRFTRQEKEKLLLPFVRNHGDQALSYATLQDGLEYFITDKGYIAYAKAFHSVFAPKGRCIALENPLCAPEDRTKLVEEFLRWNPDSCFLVISEDFAAELRMLGFKANCGGPEPELDVQTYNTQGNWKELDLIKRARNEAKRKGVTIREVEIETVPVEQLQDASRVWMQTKILQTREIWIYARPPVFAHEPGVRKFVAFDLSGKAIGFVFYDPMYRQGKVFGYAANTVRCDEIHYGKIATAIHMEAIEVFRQEGIETLNLCLAPFVKMDEGKFNDDAFCTHYFKLCERYGNDIYNFRGLAFHKSKYRGSNKYVYIASKSRFPANDVYLAYQTAGVAVSYLRSTGDLLRGIIKGVWQEKLGKSKPVAQEKHDE